MSNGNFASKNCFFPALQNNKNAVLRNEASKIKGNKTQPREITTATKKHQPLAWGRRVFDDGHGAISRVGTPNEVFAQLLQTANSHEEHRGFLRVEIADVRTCIVLPVAGAQRNLLTEQRAQRGKGEGGRGRVHSRLACVSRQAIGQAYPLGWNIVRTGTGHD